MSKLVIILIITVVVLALYVLSVRVRYWFFKRKFLKFCDDIEKRCKPRKIERNTYPQSKIRTGLHPEALEQIKNGGNNED